MGSRLVEIFKSIDLPDFYLDDEGECNETVNHNIQLNNHHGDFYQFKYNVHTDRSGKTEEWFEVHRDYYLNGNEKLMNEDIASIIESYLSDSIEININ